ncbi:hypothetical protein CDAR_18691 [Caerostris darwini]|uniref:Uncharacterized protein n=1 Tax=Caerostris darwini TaxID=1538125 RepID=A0AAV4RHQ3_9ARAC|nr:hypothetical protein CDAR_18691 [Caerostris darwini]
MINYSPSACSNAHPCCRRKNSLLLLNLALFLVDITKRLLGQYLHSAFPILSILDFPGEISLQETFILFKPRTHPVQLIPREAKSSVRFLNNETNGRSRQREVYPELFLGISIRITNKKRKVQQTKGTHPNQKMRHLWTPPPYPLPLLDRFDLCLSGQKGLRACHCGLENDSSKVFFLGEGN